MSSAEFAPESPLERSTDEPDLFQRIRRIGARAEKQILLATSVAALLLHVSAGAASSTLSVEIRQFLEQVQNHTLDRLSLSYDIELDEPEPEPEAPAPEEPEPEAPEPEPEAPAPEPTPAPIDAPSEPSNQDAPPPAAAEAGAVLTADPDPNVPLDLTDQGFISGTGTRYVGGVTASTGTAQKAVRDPGARAGGVEGGKGTNPNAAPTVNRSRPAGLPQGTSWNCDFPPEADAEQINHAVVRLVVIVGPDGSPKSVNIVEDPGYGFGRLARRCALSKKYEPSLDASGKPIAGATPPFRVRFQR